MAKPTQAVRYGNLTIAVKRQTQGGDPTGNLRKYGADCGYANIADMCRCARLSSATYACFHCGDFPGSDPSPKLLLPKWPPHARPTAHLADYLPAYGHSPGLWTASLKCYDSHSMRQRVLR